MRSRALALLPVILMATRLLFGRQALTATSRQPLPSCENPASEKNHPTHDSLALAPTARSRLPVNFDSSHGLLPVVLFHPKHCARVVIERQGERY